MTEMIFDVELSHRTPEVEGEELLVPNAIGHYCWPEYSKDVALDIKENKRVLLTGHTGTGKTSLIQQFAAKINQPAIRVNLNGQTTVSDFVGFWMAKDGEMVWVDGSLPKAMRAGYWLILDEIDFAEAEILAVLNSVLEPNGALTLKERGHEMIAPHPDFRLFATANTVGCMLEYRSLYQGTNILNEAFLDRWRVYHVTYLPADKESEVLAASVGRMNVRITTVLVQVASMVREAFEKEEVSCTFSLRRLIDWTEMMVRHRDPLKAAENTVFSKIAREDAEVIRGIIQRVTKN